MCHVLVNISVVCVHVHVHVSIVVHDRVVMFKEWFQSFVLVFNMLNIFSMCTMFYLNNTLFSKDQYILILLYFSLNKI